MALASISRRFFSVYTQPCTCAATTLSSRLFNSTSTSSSPQRQPEHHHHNTTTPAPPSRSSSFITSLLGYTGAIPFLAYSAPLSPLLPTALLFNTDPALIQVGYGATILSFLGGVHWGTALATGSSSSTASSKKEGPSSSPSPSTTNGMQQLRYIWSVTPCLLAWPTLFMFPSYTEAAGVQAMLIGLVYVVDRWFMNRDMLPRWYLRELRLPLSIAASIGLVGTALLG